MSQLFERIRPVEFSQVVGQDAAVAKIVSLGTRRGYAGRSWLFTGASGTGKTTLAKIVAAQVADPMNVVEIDGSDCCQAWLDSVDLSSSMFGIGAKSGRAFIVNECHGLSQYAIRKLLVILERIPSHVVWIFTTTSAGAEKMAEGIDWKAFTSRSVVVPLSRQGIAEPYAEYAQRIAVAEGLDGGQPFKRFLALARESINNLRAMLQEIDAGCMLEVEIKAAA